MTDIFYKGEFIHALSDKTGYTLRDTENFVNAMIEYFEDCITNGVEFNVRGFGKLYVQTIPPRKGYVPVKGKKGAGEFKEFPEAKRVIFKLSRNLRNLVKYDWVDDEDEEEEEPIDE